MQPSSSTAGTTPSWPHPERANANTRSWLAFGAAACCVLVGSLLIATGAWLPAAGAIGAGTALAVGWAWPIPAIPKLSRSAIPAQTKHRPRPGDADLYLDLDAVEVEAVYVLGTELFTHLRGGVGQRKDPVTGDQRQIETSEVSLTWRCHGRRTAERLADKLNEWEHQHTPLRLLAARGRCALLMEDDDNWVVLPELRLAA
jgi:hypothetical protein